ncbi:MAG: conjugal transfer protein TrbF, partial [Alphaproteobacteria bacterium]|nr:conjugal transfer protein TrbF [Alphaproteobacteria bacterium]
EQTYDSDTLAGTARWTAILSVMMRTPSTVEVLRENPLGLYVTAIAWSRDLSPSDIR